MVVTRPFIGKLLDRKSLKIILYPAYAIMTISMITLGFAKSLAAVVLAGVLKAVGQGSGGPSIQAFSLKQLGVEKAGVVSSTCFIGQDVGNALAPIIGGMVAQRFGYTTMFTSYAILLLVVGWTLYTIKRKSDAKKYPDAPQ